MKLAPVLFAAALVAVACAPAVAPDPVPAGAPPALALETLPVADSTVVGAAEVHARLAAERAKRLADLEAYTQAGVFPTNRLSRDAAPVFRGDNGAYCAVGHLMIKDGQQALVDLIVDTNNLIRLSDHPESEASQWILGSGLTYEECALIQPSYHWRGRPGLPPHDEIDLPDPRPDIVGRELTQERLRAVLRKLQQDTHQSLQVALRRAMPQGSSFTFADGRMAVLVDNPGAGSLLVRVTPPGAAPGTWRTLASGQSCRVEGEGIVEWRPASGAPAFAHTQ